jgi:hypothetical protein
MACINDISLADLCADGCIEINDSHPYVVEVFDLVVPGCRSPFGDIVAITD